VKAYLAIGPVRERGIVCLSLGDLPAAGFVRSVLGAEFAVDDCLDQGGAWNASTKACQFS
jgi:hypothetical protein